MARSLNPKAGDAAKNKPAPPAPPAVAPNPVLTPASVHSPPSLDRRDMLVASLSVIFGGVAGVFPVFAGLPVLLSPIFRQKNGGGSGSKFPLLRVGTIDSIPADGTPIAVPVLADKVDAWTREAGQPIGSVFLRRKGEQVECFNAICPHAGCRVAFSAERNLFQCPCHTSAFETDGGRILPSPSPRDMDKLEVDGEKLKTGEVWIAFANFYPGKEHPEAKS